MPPSSTAQANGDGFSADSGTSDISLKNSTAYDNQDGGFDLASEATSCENSRPRGQEHRGAHPVLWHDRRLCWRWLLVAANLIRISRERVCPPTT